MRTPLNANITICKVEGYWNVIFDYVSVEFLSTHPLVIVLTAIDICTTNHLATIPHQPPHKGGWLY